MIILMDLDYKYYLPNQCYLYNCVCIYVNGYIYIHIYDNTGYMNSYFCDMFAYLLIFLSDE